MTALRLNDPLLAYPVGSIYMSVNSTSPETLFGGTWERITGRFLLAATDGGNSGASQDPGNTGGNATVNLSHRHSQSMRTSRLSYTSGIGFKYTEGESVATSTVYTGYELSSSQSIIPPFLSVYVWKRTA